jgi:hypothetical protein
MAFNITSIQQTRKDVSPPESAEDAGRLTIPVPRILDTYKEVRYVSIPISTLSETLRTNYRNVGLLQGDRFSIQEGIITALLEWAKAKAKAKSESGGILEVFKLPGIGAQNGLKLLALLSGMGHINYEFAAVVQALYELDRNGHTAHNMYTYIATVKNMPIMQHVTGATPVDTVTHFVKKARDIRTITAGVTSYLVADEDLQTEKYFRGLAGCQIITGGGGTGKTTTIIQAIKYFMAEKNTVMVLAPTNKAKSVLLSRLPDDCQHIVFTVDKYGFMEDFEADVLIVDECSMLTNAHFTILRKAPARMWTYLVGDVQQLPPVGTGSLFADLIAGSHHPIQRLDVNYRTESLDILDLAGGLIKGRKFRVIPSANVEVVEHPDYEAMALDINSHVITHTRAVCSHVNKLMGDMARAHGLPLKFKYTSNDDAVWYRNRMVRRRGTVYCDADTGEALERGKEFNEHHLEPGFCTTIHTAQGGGWDTVYLILDISKFEVLYNQMETALLYTAVTRAKKRLVIITGRDYINLKRYPRVTALNAGLL